jgi:hypothetical protein
VCPLRHPGQPAAPLFEVQLGQVDTVDQNPAGGRRDEAEEQVEHGALAAATRAYERDPVGRRDREVDGA